MINPTNNVERHPALVDSYIKHGWKLVPIPSGTKGPTHKNWNKEENSLKSSSDLPETWGVGLAHAYSGTMALDIDHWGRAVEEFTKFGIDLNALYAAHDAVIIDSGKEGHGKLLYKMPEGLVLPSKKLIDTDENNAKYNYIDFRCASKSGNTSQDVLPSAGVHPETQRPYRWAGKGKWTNLPEIPFQLLIFWQSLLAEETSHSPVDRPTDTVINWQDVNDALSHISPDISRDEWVHIGMALFWAGHETGYVDYAFQLWDSWSASSKGTNWEGKPKYQGTSDLKNVWNSLRLDGDVITLGTLFEKAIEAGYKKPAPDASLMFESIKNKGTLNVFDILRPASPEANLELFPSVLARRAEEISVSVGCDPLVPLFAGLGAVCAALDSRTRLELMDGFKVPPVLWLMTIGDPSDKKSPGSKPMFKTLKQLEYEDRPRYKNDMLAWEGVEAAHVASKKVFLEYAAQPEAMLENDAPPIVAELPPQPVPVRLTVGDITSQKLVRTVAERPRGLLCYLDEMNSWVDKMTSRTSGEDRSSWVQAFEADSYEMDRVGSGSIHCENFAVSIYGNIQPAVFKDAVNTMSKDGMLQRFIPAVLSSNKTVRNEPIPDSLTNIPQWDNLIRTIYALPAFTYKLSPEAFEVYRAFQSWYQSTRFTERVLKADDTFMTAFGKLEGQVGRLALIWHVQESPYDLEISKTTMLKVVALTKDYIVPALKFTFGEVAGLYKDTLDHWLSEHIIHNADLETISLRDIKHSARRKLAKLNVRNSAEGSAMVKDAMIALEYCQWVSIASETRTNTIWSINPELKETFKDIRETVINAKQERYDSIYASALEKNGDKPVTHRVAKGFKVDDDT